ncbi:APC membrane recruitment protein 1 [Pelodytes ibericus]
METGHTIQETTGTKSSLTICEKSDCIRYDADTGKVETCIGQSGLFLDQQTTGKQKKSPFKFFTGRRSICTLPSFFGGKHKGLSKGSSRKALSKSKTHDGLSDVQEEDGKKDRSVHRYDGHEHTKSANTLPSSQSADSAITSPVKLDFNFHDSSPLGSTECFDKKLNGEKSLSFPRPKKGLKGLFSSIRRHKKSKALDPEKYERSDHVVPSVILEQVIPQCQNEQEHDDQPKEGCVDTVSPQNSPEAAQENDGTLECSESISQLPSPTDKDLTLDTDLLDPINQNHSLDSQTDCAVGCSNPEGVIPETLNTDCVDRDPPSLSGGDQISLIFEDVSSLKSFDSFTGCGDIIAEQDIENMSDNAISLERSREATKRSSCLVTYQGGGEEMATPDDMEEEYLHQLFEETSCAEVKIHINQEKENEERFTQLESSDYPLGVKDPFDRTPGSNTELLTPQSDQQESAPNSDEGYYDSTTPGPEDESAECFTHKERLPRDSYSGDALYEFYEPDDNLMSPAPGGESLYESKTPCSEMFDQFFDFSLPADCSLIQDAERKKGATETEEERLAMIQKQLLFWERQREAALKGMEDPIPDFFSKEKKNVECEDSAALLMCRSKSGLGSELEVLQKTSNDAIGKGMQDVLENQSWKDFQEMSLSNTKAQESYMQHLEVNGHKQDTGFELNVNSLGAQDHGDARTASAGIFSDSNITPMHHVQNVFGPDYDSHNECDQTSNFSETLVDNGMLFSSISECLGRTGSRSSFHRNLYSLPTMVTFDIVDVENEGECDQQLELSPDEEEDASFETFNHSYMQESLADCEEQLFQMNSQLPFPNYNWGVASLPRHLDHYKLNPSMPLPLSLNRRSKSLDTESLGFELEGLNLPKNILKSNDQFDREEDGKNTWNYGDRCPLRDEAGYDCSFLDQGIQTAGKCERYMPLISLKHGSNKNPKSPILSKQPSQHSKQIPRTNTTLPCNSRQSKEVSNSYHYYKENTTKKLALVMPLEENWEVDFDAPLTSDKRVKTKPVGITQAMPQQHKNVGDFLKTAENYKEQSILPKKGTIDVPDDWSNNYSECTNS